MSESFKAHRSERLINLLSYEREYVLIVQSVCPAMVVNKSLHFKGQFGSGYGNENGRFNRKKAGRNGVNN